MIPFNLLDEPWIPCRKVNNNEVVRVSLSTLIVEAPSWQRIEHASPLVTISIYRVVLALLHRALQGPEDYFAAKKLIQTGSFPKEKVNSYFAQWRERFELFHDQTPFYQMPDLPLEGYADPWTRLSAEYGSGNTSFLYNYALREKKPGPPVAISFAEAACRLLEFQQFALGGLMKRFVTSASAGLAVPGVLILADGPNLFEQLCLSLIPYSKGDWTRDKPIWERQPYTRERLNKTEGVTESVSGIASLYTWFARSIKLYPEAESGTVRQIAVAAGVVAAGVTDQDPMMAVTYNEKGEPRTLSFREGRELWRDFHALMPHRSDAHRPSKIVQHCSRLLSDTQERSASFRVYGICKDQAKVLGMHAESFTLPEIARTNSDFGNFVKERLRDIDNVRYALMAAGKRLAECLLAHGDRKPLGTDIASLADSFPHLEAYLPAAREQFLHFILKELPPDDATFDARHESLIQSWSSNLRLLARRSFDKAELAAGTSAAALKGITQGRQLLNALVAKHLPQVKEGTHV